MALLTYPDPAPGARPGNPFRAARRAWRGGGLDFPQKAATVLAIAAGVAIVVKLAAVLLLAFGSVLVAILLQAMAGPIARRTPLNRPAALAAAVGILLGALTLVLWLFGQQAAIQLAALVELLPRAWIDLQARLSASPLGGLVLRELQRVEHDGLLLSLGSALVRNGSASLAAAVIVFFAGLYLAFHPRTYLGGLVRLVPQSARGRTTQVLEACGEALNRWLVGQLISMALVGVTTGLGLWAVGVRTPLALGVLAGLGQFIPVVGPGVAMVPGLLIGLSQGPETFAAAALVYLAAMQFEANVVTPLLLRQMVELPMAVTLFAVLAMGVLLGPLGVLFATPLAVVAYVLVRMIYVEGVLGDNLTSPIAAEASG